MAMHTAVKLATHLTLFHFPRAVQQRGSCSCCCGAARRTAADAPDCQSQCAAGRHCEMGADEASKVRWISTLAAARTTAESILVSENIST